MEQLVNEIRPGYADRVINERLASARAPSNPVFTKHYNQGEEYFIELADSFAVPRLPIHHDVRERIPRADYINSLRDCIEELLSVTPNFFSDLTYFFDPGEVLKPCFYRLYRVGESYYLYLLRVDLTFRPLEAELLERGSNDETAAYRSRRLYLESDFIPLASVLSELGKVIAFAIKQTISQTWIGETGKGYIIHGIWMDLELTKFFSKLFLPSDRRTYPFYPLTCKYKTMCMTVPNPGPEERRKLLPYLHAALDFIIPEIDKIQHVLKAKSFSNSIPLFKELAAKVHEGLKKPWTALSVTPYLNANNQKEFRVDF